jgi:hypothetical protein
MSYPILVSIIYSRFKFDSLTKRVSPMDWIIEADIYRANEALRLAESQSERDIALKQLVVAKARQNGYRRPVEQFGR